MSELFLSFYLFSAKKLFRKTSTSEPVDQFIRRIFLFLLLSTRLFFIFMKRLQAFHFANLVLILIVLLLAVVIFSIFVILFHFRAASFGANVLNCEVGEPSETKYNSDK